jgi:hypothetical protein
MTGEEAWKQEGKKQGGDKETTGEGPTGKKARKRRGREGGKPAISCTQQGHTFAMPSSESKAKALASRVFFRWVPPQNSMEKLRLEGAAGSASSWSTGTPTETTRTGSG